MMSTHPETAFSGGAPGCLQFLAGERRWVGWRWEERNGRRSKPPIRIVDGRAAGYAKNDKTMTWALLPAVLAAVEAGGLDGIGLQLLNLTEFAAVDLDDVRDPSTGAVFDWADELIRSCASYTEVTPSGKGLRILGRVGPDFPPTHRGARGHPGGGKFEVYANTTTGRYITVSGDRLPSAPDVLNDIDRQLGDLLAIGSGDGQLAVAHNAASQKGALAFEALPEGLQRLITTGITNDRSADFQRAVVGLRSAGVGKDEALEMLRSHPQGPAAKYVGRLEKEFDRSWLKAESWVGREQSNTQPADGQTTNTEITEDFVAALLTERYHNEMLFDHDQQAWYLWADDIWRRDETGEVLNRCRTIARELSRSSGPRQRTNAGRAGFASGAERLARVDRTHAARQADWDRDVYRLGVPGGVVDLRTGALNAPRRDDRITRRASVRPADVAGCPLWRSFLTEVTDGDTDFVSYLKRLVGYSLTGITTEQSLAFVYGPGGNGKSVFVNTISAVLEDYVRSAPMETFTASSCDRHPTDLAMLAGARLVIASETTKGRSWAESRIKLLTGGDPITARFMRKDFFTFLPQFKLLMVGNHKPVLLRVDAAIRRRFQIIPFVHKPAQPDPGLEEKLRGERPAILRWAIEGCLEWQAGGLAPPRCVRMETEEYFDGQDLVGQWLDEHCVVAPGNGELWTPIANLYASWSAYSKAAGEVAETKKAFAMELDKRGLPNDRLRIGRTQSRIRRGIALRECLRTEMNDIVTDDDTS